MCSIFGINKNLSKNEIDLLNIKLKLRGPDATNIIQYEGYTFLHNLLSITGKKTLQPFFDQDVVCLFNGQIYNYLSFGNYDSDGCCIIDLYKKHGKDFAKMLDGEYAIVICDFKNNEIILTTDLFATKPLYILKEKETLGFSSYKSSFTNLGYKNVLKIPANKTYVLSLDTFSVKEKKDNYSLNLNQFKNSYDDWVLAFKNSIKKRTATDKNILIGLSSGFDSGCIAHEVSLQAPGLVHTYSIKAQENEQVIKNRIKQNNVDSKFYYLTQEDFARNKQFIKKLAEEHQYKIKRNNNLTPGELMTNDKGAVGLSFICEQAKKDGCLIYLSGQGADEIFSDYGFAGKTIYNHSSFAGKFPEDLNTIFPWNNFFQGTQYSYLGKEENVAGAWGIEGRYPFLDKDVVQEFLWLKSDLKNKNYKSVLTFYLEKYKIDFEKNKKIGFSCDKNLQ